MPTKPFREQNDCFLLPLICSDQCSVEYYQKWLNMNRQIDKHILGETRRKVGVTEDFSSAEGRPEPGVEAETVGGLVPVRPGPILRVHPGGAKDE